MCKATVTTVVMYAVQEEGMECSGTIELGPQTHCRGSGVDVESMGTLQILKDKNEASR